MLLCPSCGGVYREPQTLCDDDQAVLQPAADLDWRIGSEVGNYRLLDLLGRGGMGTVYQAEHIYIGKRAAIKILNEDASAIPGAVERLLAEARAAATIGHPNIVDVSDFGATHDGLSYFVMELVEGRALDEVIHVDGALSLLRAINIANQIGRGLGAAHEKGIVHRDLKPANVMLQKRAGRREIVRRTHDDYAVEREESYDFVKILDFGVAKVRSAEASSTVDEVLGTPHYMAPEAVHGAATADHRIDIYALGVMFFEMVTGCVPFDGATSLDVLLAHRSQSIPTLHELNPTVPVTDSAERLVQRTMAKDPAERPQNMDEFLLELQQCYGDETFLRNAEKQMPAAVAAGRRPRPRRLTEELSELFARGSGSEILERALADDPAKNNDDE